MSCYMILLAGGSGKRMHSDIPKQFLEVAGKPMITHSLDAVERSSIVDACILVTAQSDLEYMEKRILSAGNYRKVRAVVTGGKERYESVLNGLKKMQEIFKIDGKNDIVMIHDGARPCLTEEILNSCREGALRYRACVAAVPSKDTVTIADEEGFEKMIPPRRNVWIVQTPQAFAADEILSAFEKLEEEICAAEGMEKFGWITDDAAVAEYFNGTKIKIVQGNYRNIKVTTPEDLKTVEEFLKGEKSPE